MFHFDSHLPILIFQNHYIYKAVKSIASLMQERMWEWWEGCCIFISNCGKLGKKKTFKIKSLT